MPEITLDAFLHPDHSYPRNAYVLFKGFKRLYVRKGPYLVNNEIIHTIQIASLEAENTGTGSFRKLIDHLTEKYPNVTIVVECVLSDTLASILEHLGFERINAGPNRNDRHYANCSTRRINHRTSPA